uniref:Putative secreted peptide n=1 Tax=Anopheles braziliensis TaxID=58242 RepID=A0A2M3ZM75_9DIPT
MRRLARPVFFFFFSFFSTFGVWPFTLPARASEPCTLPPSSPTVTSSSGELSSLTNCSSASGLPSHQRLSATESSMDSASASIRLTSWMLFSGRTSRICVFKPRTCNCIFSTPLEGFDGVKQI